MALLNDTQTGGRGWLDFASLYFAENNPSSEAKVPVEFSGEFGMTHIARERERERERERVFLLLLSKDAACVIFGRIVCLVDTEDLLDGFSSVLF